MWLWKGKTKIFLWEPQDICDILNCKTGLQSVLKVETAGPMTFSISCVRTMGWLAKDLIFKIYLGCEILQTRDLKIWPAICWEFKIWKLKIYLASYVETHNLAGQILKITNLHVDIQDFVCQILKFKFSKLKIWLVKYLTFKIWLAKCWKFGNSRFGLPYIKNSKFWYTIIKIVLLSIENVIFGLPDEILYLKFKKSQDLDIQIWLARYWTFNIWIFKVYWKVMIWMFNILLVKYWKFQM